MWSRENTRFDRPNGIILNRSRRVDSATQYLRRRRRRRTGGRKRDRGDEWQSWMLESSFQSAFLCVCVYVLLCVSLLRVIFSSMALSAPPSHPCSSSIRYSNRSSHQTRHAPHTFLTACRLPFIPPNTPRHSSVPNTIHLLCLERGSKNPCLTQLLTFLIPQVTLRCGVRV